METIITQLFAARDIAHRLHLRAWSFSIHMALNDLYEALVDMADRLAEIYQGKYGLMNIANPVFTFSDDNPITFIKEHAQWAENTRSVFNSEDTHLLGEWDSVISIIYRAKYKLENLA